jgi:hypothetical protein
MLGTWHLRGRTEYLDRGALAQAMRYTHAARAAAQNTARELAAPELADLETMRTHNTALQNFVVTVDVPDSGRDAVTPTPVASSLAAVRSARQKQTQRRAVDHRAARAALRNLAT